MGKVLHRLANEWFADCVQHYHWLISGYFHRAMGAIVSLTRSAHGQTLSHLDLTAQPEHQHRGKGI